MNGSKYSPRNGNMLKGLKNIYN